MKGDWVGGTTLWVNALNVSTNTETAEITSVGVTYSILLPSGTTLGYQYIYLLPEPIPQLQVTTAITAAIDAATAYEGLPL